ncbi:uncharacterized protein BDR25DRAFT_352029 [Lindgomyces ingoldianus]|uniref:Uncharacterized protein n=1 Tax=Lindgomyces ingoldianus TaxID=673940 RepID=A0ACB6R2Q6_9PLEO|nr:uncharacterized protein BDR25DRAFT_352029 [Lindgomyces ingoldianus]KAF2473534.1 hypothetical protein BDR25DRAFT_352029 [Lindgomyces ingoldianus]
MPTRILTRMPCFSRLQEDFYNIDNFSRFGSTSNLAKTEFWPCGSVATGEPAMPLDLPPTCNDLYLPEPLSFFEYSTMGLDAIIDALNTTINFAELLIHTIRVSTGDDIFVRSIQIMRNDLNEVERLLGNESVRRKLTAVPRKLEWIRGAITNTKLTFNAITQCAQSACVDQQVTKSIRPDPRLRERLINRQTELSTCHQQISNVLNFLNPLEEIPVSSDPPTYHDTTYFDDILSPQQNREGMMKSGQTSKSQQAKVEGKSTPFSYILQSTRPGEPYDLRANLLLVHNNTPPAYVSVPQTIQPQELDTVEGKGSHLSFPKQKTTSECALLSSPSPSLQTPKYLPCSMKNLPPSSDYIQQPLPNATTGRKHQQGVPEPIGATHSLCGTNAQGPVNPYEFFPDLEPESPKLGSNSRPVHALSEMPGDTSFPVEIQAYGSGSSPRYPRPGVRSIGFELPTQYPSQRTVQYNPSEDYPIAAHKSPSPNPASVPANVSQQELPVSRQNFHSGFTRLQQSRFELPSSPGYPVRKPEYPQYPSPTSALHSSTPSLKSTKYTPSPLLAPSMGRSTRPGVGERLFPGKGTRDGIRCQDADPLVFNKEIKTNNGSLHVLSNEDTHAQLSSPSISFNLLVSSCVSLDQSPKSIQSMHPFVAALAPTAKCEEILDRSNSLTLVETATLPHNTGIQAQSNMHSMSIVFITEPHDALKVPRSSSAPGSNLFLFFYSVMKSLEDYEETLLCSLDTQDLEVLPDSDSDIDAMSYKHAVKCFLHIDPKEGGRKPQISKLHGKNDSAIGTPLILDFPPMLELNYGPHRIPRGGRNPGCIRAALRMVCKETVERSYRQPLPPESSIMFFEVSESDEVGSVNMRIKASCLIEKKHVGSK